MNNQDWERFGEDIRRTIQDAVEYGNYDRLNQTIANTVNQATDWVNKNVANKGKTHHQGPFGQGPSGFGKPNHGAAGYGQSRYEPPNYGQRNYAQPNYQYAENSVLYQKKPVSKVGAILLATLGYGMGAMILIWAVLVIIVAIMVGEALAGIVLTGVNLILIGVCAFLAYKGTTTSAKLRRFNTYVKEIGAAEFCNIVDLAEKVGKPVKFVVKDLEKMIQKDWFKQGHLDKQKTCLIVTDKMYQQYQQLEEQKELQRKEEAKKQDEQRKAEQSKQNDYKRLSPEVQKVVEQGDAYVRKIRECNDAIPGEEISEKISRIENIVDKIFDRVEQNPDSVSDIQKLMDYYLPTTVKLLDAYAEMDAQPVYGENIQTAKREIEATLDTLNVAFEKLLDSLFQDAAWDVSSDISVLNTMLAQEGLKDDGLRKS